MVNFGKKGLFLTAITIMAISACVDEDIDTSPAIPKSQSPVPTAPVNQIPTATTVPVRPTWTPVTIEQAKQSKALETSRATSTTKSTKVKVSSTATKIEETPDHGSKANDEDPKNLPTQIPPKKEPSKKAKEESRPTISSTPIPEKTPIKIKPPQKIIPTDLFPDLVISEIFSDPKYPSVGDEVIWNVTVRNDGAEDSGEFKVSLDKDRHPEESPIETQSVPNLYSGESITITFQRTADNPKGYWFMADFNNRVKELNEENNIKESKLFQTDLMIEKVTHIPVNPVAGQEVLWTATIRNDGKGNAHNFKVSFDTDSDPQLEPEDTAFVDFLSAGDRTSVTFKRLFNTREPNYWVMTDYGNHLNESDENNNIFRTEVGLSDLYISEIFSIPENPAAGDKATWTIIVGNKGQSESPPFMISIDTDRKPSVDPIDWQEAKTLKVGQESSHSFTIIVEDGKEYSFMVDSEQTVPESNEGNNIVSKTLAMPDLQIVKVEANPKVPKIGEELKWTIIVKNIGLGNSLGFTLQLDNDKNPKDDDPLIVPLETVPLKSGDERSLVIVYTPTLGANYWLYVDPENNVFESNEENNTWEIANDPIDLQLISIIPSNDTPALGEQVEWEVTIFNNSSKESPSFDVAFDIDSTPASNPYQTKNINSLGPKDTKVLTFSSEASLDSKYWVLIDYLNVIPDPDRTNNGRNAKLKSIELPDLVISEISSYPETVKKGTLIDWAIKIINNGKAKSGPFVLRMDDSLSVNETPFEDMSHDGLRPKESVVITFKKQKASESNYFFIVDATQTVEEKSESNNTSQGFLALPDLLISKIVPSPLKPSEGELIKWSVEVLNQGTGNAPLSIFAFDIDEDTSTPS